MRSLILVGVLWLFAISGVGGQGSISLRDFESDEVDSILQCAIIHRYEDYTRYLENILSRTNESDPRVRVASKTALIKLTASSRGAIFQVEDEILEGKKNYFYKRSEFIELIDDLSSKNVVFEKQFLAHTCPEVESSSRSEPIAVGNNYVTYPVIYFKMGFIELSKISRTLHSNIRDSDYTDFEILTKKKQIKFRVYKELDPDARSSGLDSMVLINKQLSGMRRDTTGKYKELTDCLLRLEGELSYNAIEILYIKEEEYTVSEKEVSRMGRLGENCACNRSKPPDDADNDNHSILVDCNDNDPSIYPGAPISRDNGWPDDNCDGEIDKFCDDLDGDGFVGGPDCDCDPTLDKKCDCDDSDDTVYPGALLNCANGKPDDDCDGVPDTSQLQSRREIKLNIADMAYPPWGLTKFGKDGRFYAYSGLMVAGIGSTVYFKVKSDQKYDEYKESSRLAERDKLYSESNKDHQRFLVSFGSTLLVYGLSHLDLHIRFGKYRRDLKSIEQFRDDCVDAYGPKIEIEPLKFIDRDQIGMALTLRF